MIISRTMVRSPVDVLFGTDSLGDRALAVCTDVRAEGELHQYTADGGVRVELLDYLDDLFEGGLLGEGNVRELDANLLRGLCLHPHVYAGIRTCTRLDDGQLWLEAGALGLETLDTLCDLRAYIPGKGEGRVGQFSRL